MAFTRLTTMLYAPGMRHASAAIERADRLRGLYLPQGVMGTNALQAVRMPAGDAL